ncbi:hypothetical protein [Streptomyces sp. NPDC003023]|uniref:hypothetical protein n=1 Tax=Streptomyces sp. NPDC003023 TaxID=3364675 RepID=UPI00369E3AEE
MAVTELGGGRKPVTVQRPQGATGALRSEISGGRITVVPDEARSSAPAASTFPAAVGAAVTATGSAGLGVFAEYVDGRRALGLSVAGSGGLVPTAA